MRRLLQGAAAIIGCIIALVIFVGLLGILQAIFSATLTGVILVIFVALGAEIAHGFNDPDDPGP